MWKFESLPLERTRITVELAISENFTVGVPSFIVDYVQKHSLTESMRNFERATTRLQLGDHPLFVGWQRTREQARWRSSSSSSSSGGSSSSSSGSGSGSSSSSGSGSSSSSSSGSGPNGPSPLCLDGALSTVRSTRRSMSLEDALSTARSTRRSLSLEGALQALSECFRSARLSERSHFEVLAAVAALSTALAFAAHALRECARRRKQTRPWRRWKRFEVRRGKGSTEVVAPVRGRRAGSGARDGTSSAGLARSLSELCLQDLASSAERMPDRSLSASSLHASGGACPSPKLWNRATLW
jgi:hypothetical protein